MPAKVFGCGATFGRCGRDDEKAVDITFGREDRQIGQACRHQHRNADKSQALHRLSKKCIHRDASTVVFAGPGHEVISDPAGPPIASDMKFSG